MRRESGRSVDIITFARTRPRASTATATATAPTISAITPRRHDRVLTPDATRPIDSVNTNRLRRKRVRQKTTVHEQMIRRRVVESGRRIWSNGSEFEIGILILILNRSAREREDLAGGALFPARLHR